MRALLLVAAALIVAGCMEVEQTATPSKLGKYQGKPDTMPWNNQPLAAGPQWKQGDRSSWEEQIKKRQLTQHEDRRINQ
ncbi:MAG TPA: hypothetical protein VHN19_18180 [Burkholderiales bacterium]|nr:hypothetical protein [Burkholderiales bacterium]